MYFNYWFTGKGFQKLWSGDPEKIKLQINYKIKHSLEIYPMIGVCKKVPFYYL
jgi:hypothetical protein